MARYGTWTLNFLYLAYYCATVLKKRVHIINHSIFLSNYVDNADNTDNAGNADALPVNEAEDFAQIVKLTYSAITGCCVREPESFAQLEALVPGKARLGFDCISIYIRETYAKSMIEGRNRIVISGGNFLGRWYAPFIKDLLGVLPDELAKLPVAFLFSDIAYSEISGDIALWEEVFTLLGGNIEKIAVQNTDDWLDAIGSAALLVSGRFHHSIAAFMLDTPFLAFRTDTKKMEGMLQAIEKAENLLPGNVAGAMARAGILLHDPGFFTANDEHIKEKIANLALNNFNF